MAVSAVSAVFGGCDLLTGGDAHPTIEWCGVKDVGWPSRTVCPSYDETDTRCIADVGRTGCPSSGPGNQPVLRRDGYELIGSKDGQTVRPTTTDTSLSVGRRTDCPSYEETDTRCIAEVGRTGCPARPSLVDAVSDGRDGRLSSSSSRRAGTPILPDFVGWRPRPSEAPST